MKKLVALIMAVAIFLSIAIAEGSTFPISEEPITLTVLMPQSIQLTDAATNRMVLEYEKKTNVHIDWIFTQDKNTDLNLMMASKSYPDIFMCGLSTSQITMMSEAGMIMPLNDMIEDGTCYWYAKRLEENPLWADQLTAPDGNIYTFFISDVGDHNKCPYRMYVYTSWLNQYMDATGNEAPTTTDEFEEMLTYFRDNDMNGNGDTGDEIPLIASTDSFDNPIYYLMSAFGFVSENYHHIDNGNIVFEANTDYWREGLRWVNHLYTEGLFDAEATFVQDRTQFRALVNRQADEFIVGSVEFK